MDVGCVVLVAVEAVHGELPSRVHAGHGGVGAALRVKVPAAPHVQDHAVGLEKRTRVFKQKPSARVLGESEKKTRFFGLDGTTMRMGPS